jgi:hypothetical protein
MTYLITLAILTVLLASSSTEATTPRWSRRFEGQSVR